MFRNYFTTLSVKLYSIIKTFTFNRKISKNYHYEVNMCVFVVNYHVEYTKNAKELTCCKVNFLENGKQPPKKKPKGRVLRPKIRG